MESYLKCKHKAVNTNRPIIAYPASQTCL